MSEAPMNNESTPASPGAGSLLDAGTPTGNVNDTLLGNNAPPATPAGTEPANVGLTPQPAPGVPGDSLGLMPLPDNASEDQRRDFQNKLRALAGVPNDPGGYGTFGFDDSVKIDTNGEVYKHWTSVFHDAGLNQNQAKKLLEAHNKFIANETEQYKRQTDQQILEYRAQMKAALVKDAGGEQQYEVLRNTAQQGFAAVAKGAKLNEQEVKGILNVMGDDSRFVKMFAHIGKSFREDVLITGASPSAPEKSFDDIIDGLFK